MRNEFNFVKTKFSKNHNKNGEIWCFAEFSEIFSEFRRKSEEYMESWGKSVENPWKSVGSP